MLLDRPFAVVTPTVDGDVLQVLASADASFTPPQIHALIGRHSVSGVRKALERLRRQGIVRSERAGKAFLYRLNRDHLAAPHIVGLAGQRAELFRRIEDELAAWKISCAYAALFGSAASGAMREESDVDLFIARPDPVEADYGGWRAQIDVLAAAVSSWTGNDTRILELSNAEVMAGLKSGAERVLADVRDKGLRLAGPQRYLVTPMARGRK